jgi:hypothetical protein
MTQDPRIAELQAAALVATGADPDARKILDLFPGTRIVRPMIVRSTDPQPPVRAADPEPPAPITFDQKYRR